MSIEQADAIISEFETALSERATLSDSRLKAYGYNDSEIALLRSYANGQPLSPAELKSLSATCNAEIIRHYCYEDAAMFSYQWTWNRCPTIALADSSAIRWLVHKSDDVEIGVEVTSTTLRLDYYCVETPTGGSSSNLCYSGNYGYQEPNLDASTINMQFTVMGNYFGESGLAVECYAKHGVMMVGVKVPDGTTATINNIFVSGLYGHTLVGVGSPSVTVGADSVSLGFTGSTYIDSIASRKATLRTNSTAVYYWS